MTYENTGVSSYEILPAMLVSIYLLFMQACSCRVAMLFFLICAIKIFAQTKTASLQIIFLFTTFPIHMQDRFKQRDTCTTNQYNTQLRSINLKGNLWGICFIPLVEPNQCYLS